MKSLLFFLTTIFVLFSSSLEAKEKFFVHEKKWCGRKCHCDYTVKNNKGEIIAEFKDTECGMKLIDVEDDGEAEYFFPITRDLSMFEEIPKCLDIPFPLLVCKNSKGEFFDCTGKNKKILEKAFAVIMQRLLEITDNTPCERIGKIPEPETFEMKIMPYLWMIQEGAPEHLVGNKFEFRSVLAAIYILKLYLPSEFKNFRFEEEIRRGKIWFSSIKEELDESFQNRVENILPGTWEKPILLFK